MLTFFHHLRPPSIGLCSCALDNEPDQNVISPAPYWWEAVCASSSVVRHFIYFRYQTKLALVCSNVFNPWRGQKTLGVRFVPAVGPFGMTKRAILTFTCLRTRELKAKPRMLYISSSKIIMKSTIWLTMQPAIESLKMRELGTGRTQCHERRLAFFV